MWLEAKRDFSLIRGEPNDNVVSWTVDVKAAVDEELAEAEDERSIYTIGRLLADELRRYEIEECGLDVWETADADSAGLEAAWASLLSEDGEFRQEDFEGCGDPVVYVYRFEVHPDFAMWRMPAMDAFCRIFSHDAIILAQHHTTWFSEAEFERIGFYMLPPTRFEAPAGLPIIDRKTRFMVRENAFVTPFGICDYPEDAPPARRAHEEWIEKQGLWRGLV